MKTKTIIAALAALLLTAPGARGQVAWETPHMMPPGAPRGLGIYLMEVTPGGGLGAMVSYRRADAPAGLGFRGGLADGPFDDVSVFGGIDVSGFLVRESSDVPLDVLWSAGLGLGVGEYALLSFPFGVTVGKIFRVEEMTLNPYVGPRLVLDARFGDGAPGDDLDLGLAADVGVDLSFDPRWAIRVGASIGDREALAVGVVLPGAAR